jgi:two-component system, LytTR family, response regulator
MKAKIRAAIVDDEPLARERLRNLIGRDAEVEIVAEASDGRAAVKAIEKAQPDLVFLDIRMPGLDGFGVLDSLRVPRLPVVVFVTAYDRYAVKAFEIHALDYLLKPFHRVRFEETLRRAKAAVRRGAADHLARVFGWMEDSQPSRRSVRRFLVKASGRVVFVRADEIDWIEAEGNYVRLHVGAASHLIRETMAKIESRLDPDRFARVHRGAIVNLDRIRELEPMFRGDYSAVLRDGSRIAVSRGYRLRLENKLAGAP